jgi:SEC-C motif-containing protein
LPKTGFPMTITLPAKTFDASRPCPCGSGRAFGTCCGALHGGRAAATAEELMRSRYSAFVVGDLDYLARTAAGEALLKFDRQALARSLAGTDWLGLEIQSKEMGGEADEIGFVSFSVDFREGGRRFRQGERSEFRRVGGAWRYVSGTVDVSAQAAASVGRNDPCPCGSGRKYKKCCGA